MRKTNPVLLTIGAIALSVLACNLPFIGEVDVNEWYVATDGSDSNRCTAESSPCATIMGALAKTGGVSGIIHVAPGTFTENVFINQSISIIGASPSLTFVDGNAAGVVFDVGIEEESSGEINVLISELTAMNGHAGNGAGIRAWEDVHLSVVNSVIRDNSARLEGGAVFNLGGWVDLNNVDISSNHSEARCNVINYSHEMDLFETRVFENTGVTGVCNWDNGRMTIRSSQIGFHPSNGVVNRGTLSVSGSEIFGNRDPEDYYLTAGIVNLGTLSVHDTLIRQGSDGITNYCNATVTDSTISDNLDTGIFYYDPARRDSIARRYGTCDAVGPNLRVSNTTISGNTRGIYMVQVRPLRYRIEHSTIAYNEIGLHNEMNHTNDSVAAVVNSLVVNNSLLDCNRHTIPAQGTNLDSDGTCSFTGRGHISNVDPLLGPLEDNGGNTPTHRLLEGSPAIDRAFEIWCLPADQRSMGRPAGGGCDIGAFELEEETVGAAREPLSGPTQTAEPLGMMVTETPEVTPTVAPIEVNFNADSYAILVGECTRLRWDVQNADLILLEGEPVPELEAEQVCPKVTKTYTLVASNTMEEVERYVNIEVTESVTSPKAPAQLNITNQVCTAQTYSVTLGWIDAADNEDGYRVYRDGNLIANLGSNAKGFTDTPPYGGPYSYGVEAFNSAGASPRPTVQEPGCIY